MIAVDLHEQRSLWRYVGLIPFYLLMLYGLWSIKGLVADSSTVGFLGWLGGILHGQLEHGPEGGPAVLDRLLGSALTSGLLLVTSLLLSLVLAVPLARLSLRSSGRSRRWNTPLLSPGIHLLSALPGFLLAVAFRDPIARALGFDWEYEVHRDLLHSGGIVWVISYIGHLLVHGLVLAIADGNLVYTWANLRTIWSQAREAGPVREGRTLGVPESKLLLRHVLPHTALDTLVFFKHRLMFILGTSAVIEWIFTRYGLGWRFIKAAASNTAGQKDLETMMAIAFVIVVMVFLGNLFIDLIAKYRVRIVAILYPLLSWLYDVYRVFGQGAGWLVRPIGLWLCGLYRWLCSAYRMFRPAAGWLLRPIGLLVGVYGLIGVLYVWNGYDFREEYWQERVYASAKIRTPASEGVGVEEHVFGESGDIYPQEHRPGRRHLLGIDRLYDRDVFAWLLAGTAVSLATAFIAMAVAIVFGVVLGGFVCYRGRVVRWVADALLFTPFECTPRFLIAALLCTTMQTSYYFESGDHPFVFIGLFALSLGLIACPEVGRRVVGEITRIQGEDFYQQIHLLGASSWQKLWRYVRPLVLDRIAVMIGYVFASVVLLEAALSYTGFWVAKNVPSLGGLLAAVTHDWFLVSKYQIAVPAIVLVGLVLSGDILARVVFPVTEEQR